MYLEISGRGTGKTYRLIEAAKAYVALDYRNVPNIILPTQGHAERLKEFVETNNKNNPAVEQFNYTIPGRKNFIVRGYNNVRNFFDDFDFMNITFNDVGFSYQDDYFCTTPARVRDLSNISIQQAAKTDLLLRLILENHGMYCSFINPMFDPSWLKPIAEKYQDDDAFEKEIEGKFIKYFL